MVNCFACRGTGFEVLDVEIPCAACEATGQVLGERCLACNGEGKLLADSKIACEFCNGTGNAVVVDPRD